MPLMVQNVAGYCITLTAAISVGRLGAAEHAAATLANSAYIITGLSLVTGLESAMETLCGQAFGARDFRAMGEMLQRALLICWTACIPVALLWSQAPFLMVAMGQRPEIAAAAGGYLMQLFPCVFLVVTADVMRKYLVAQGLALPGMCATAVAALAAPAYFHLMVNCAGWGLAGAAAAMAATHLTAAVGLVSFIVRSVPLSAQLTVDIRVSGQELFPHLTPHPCSIHCHCSP